MNRDAIKMYFAVFVDKGKGLEMVTGEYYNVFGVTRLDEDYSKISEHSIEKNAAYLHESIHYMVNIGSVFGINKALMYMSRYLGYIIQIQQGIFPMQPYDKEDQDFIYSLITWAEGDSFDNKGQIVRCTSINRIEKVNNYRDYGYNEEFPEYEHLYKNQIILHFGNIEYDFGGAAISESMAYLFEKFFFDVDDYEKDLPYNACEIVYEYIVGEKCCDLAVLIGLCYASMMTMWPGNAYVYLLEKLKHEGLRLKSMREAIEFSEEIMLEVHKGIIEDIQKKLDLIFPKEEENIIKIYENDSEYSKIWLQKKYKDIAENEREYRKALEWILDEADPDMRIPAMAQLLKEYGQPIIIDINGKLYTNGDKKLVHVLPPLALYEIIMEKKAECFLFNICKQNGGTPDKDCRTGCWNHHEAENCCVLRYYLYKMGLGATRFDQLENTPFK